MPVGYFRNHRHRMRYAETNSLQTCGLMDQFLSYTRGK